MSQFTLVNHRGEKTKTFDTRAEATENRDDMVGLGASPEDFEIVQGEYSYAEYQASEADANAVAQSDGGAEVVETPDTDPRATKQTADTPTLKEDPIGHLRSINGEFVNTIQGTPAISKRGFRYIQAELDITTESEVVAWTDDPYGVVIWARAELPDGRAAEAHGEGSPEERGMDKTEFVRYADTRAKNRALSDLTSAGALAVSEIQEGL